MIVPRIRLLIAALWGGSLWTIGYLAAPTLFFTLPDKVLAGTIASVLFRVEAWLSVCCASTLILLEIWKKNERDTSQYNFWLGLIFAMLGCTVIGYFILEPHIAELRKSASVTGIMTSDTKMQFEILHSIASGIYLIQSLLGAELIFKYSNTNKASFL